jgi:hypothetical protein
METAIVHIDPSTVRLPCGWQGCQTLISPDRVEVKHHLVKEHNVVTGEKLVRCVDPNCTKEIKADSMWQHWMTHLGVRVECTVCQSKFTARLDSFRRHVKGGCPGHGRFIASDAVETFDEDTDFAILGGPRSKRWQIN